MSHFGFTIIESAILIALLMHDEVDLVASYQKFSVTHAISGILEEYRGPLWCGKPICFALLLRPNCRCGAGLDPLYKMRLFLDSSRKACSKRL